ncbi:MAG TPA: hypothetical protein VF601_22710 [Beijerinckiaceae bacterium]|jgi:hypothetical protein
MGRRSQSRDTFAAVRYAVDTGSMPPPPRRSFWARRKRIVLPIAAAALIGAGFLATEARRPAQQPATAALDCSSAHDVWRPACRPGSVQDWVAKAASVRDDAPAATGALDDAAKRASTPKRVVEAAKSKPETPVPTPQPPAPAVEPATPAKAPSRLAAAPSAPEAPPEPARKPEAAKPAPEPVRAAETKPVEPPVRPAPPPVEPIKLPEPQPVQQAAKASEPQPAQPAPQPVEQATKLEPQPVQQTVKLAEPQVKPYSQSVGQVARPEPRPAAAEPPRRPAQPAKVAEEPAAPVAGEVDAKARQKRPAQRAARREEQRVRTIVVRPEEQPAPRRLARARPAEPGVRTTAYFPPGFVQALRHYNARYAYDY